MNQLRTQIAAALMPNLLNDLLMVGREDFDACSRMAADGTLSVFWIRAEMPNGDAPPRWVDGEQPVWKDVKL